MRFRSKCLPFFEETGLASQTLATSRDEVCEKSGLADTVTPPAGQRMGGQPPVVAPWQPLLSQPFDRLSTGAQLTLTRAAPIADTPRPFFRVDFNCKHRLTVRHDESGPDIRRIRVINHRDFRRGRRAKPIIGCDSSTATVGRIARSFAKRRWRGVRAERDRDANHRL
jgi:hypothetical protein